MSTQIIRNLSSPRILDATALSGIHGGIYRSYSDPDRTDHSPASRVERRRRKAAQAVDLMRAWQS